MADSLRVRTPDTAQVATYNGVEYPVRDGVAVIPDDGKLRQQKPDVLPVTMLSLSDLPLAEVRCTVCGRKKLALFGDQCGWCGALCEAIGG